MKSWVVSALHTSGLGCSPVFPRRACLVPRVGPGLVAALVLPDPETTAPGVSSSLEFMTEVGSLLLGYLGSSCAFFWHLRSCSVKHTVSYEKTRYRSGAARGSIKRPLLFPLQPWRRPRGQADPRGSGVKGWGLVEPISDHCPGCTLQLQTPCPEKGQWWGPELQLIHSFI